MTNFSSRICPKKYELNHPEVIPIIPPDLGLGFNFTPTLVDAYDDNAVIDSDGSDNPHDIDEDISDSLCDYDCVGPYPVARRRLLIFTKTVQVCPQDMFEVSVDLPG